MPLHGRLLRRFLRTQLPGRTRGVAALASIFPAFQRVPVAIARDQVVFLDMRDPMCADVLRDSPYDAHPWEPDEQAVMRGLLRRGDVAFDIGAHFGEHAVLMTSLVGRRGHVVAFEPNPERQHALRRTVTRRGNGELHALALTDRPGTAVLYVPEFHVTASLAEWTNGRVGSIRNMVVRQACLDDLVNRGAVPRPHFVKCDVEGAELLVFKGAAETLNRRDAPIVMYEANRPAAAAFGIDASASTEFLEGLNVPRYSFYWIQPGGTLVPVDTLRADVNLFNLVAIPASRAAALESLPVLAAAS
jgi:FkbM family methyltransferase